ncbi:hypothetical protein BT93_K0229 [Corymbia citriodora subsp. variegata]|nr:hypothetical protein BT93_K0229 [Corymbia citriodora subsp. variegata]
MSALIRKLARAAPSSLRLFGHSVLNPGSLPAPALVPHHTVLDSSRPERSRDSPRCLGKGIDGNVESSQILRVYPVFPYGFRAEPNPISSAVLDGAEPVEGDDSGHMWADSVKKKRKRKMNKHKYKKLRKRLRRKAKS